METLRKLTLLLGTAVVAAMLAAGPVAAQDDAGDEAPTDEAPTEEAPTDEAPAEEPPAEADDEAGRPTLAETPRDRLGLLLLGSLAVAGIVGWIGMRRQLSGERPTASGEFRWR